MKKQLTYAALIELLQDNFDLPADIAGIRIEGSVGAELVVVVKVSSVASDER